MCSKTINHEKYLQYTFEIYEFSDFIYLGLTFDFENS